MASQNYTLTVRTSQRSALAFCLRAPGDDAAVTLAWRVVNKLSDLCGAPRFEVARRDGTLVCDTAAREAGPGADEAASRPAIEPAYRRGAETARAAKRTRKGGPGSAAA